MTATHHFTADCIDMINYFSLEDPATLAIGDQQFYYRLSELAVNAYEADLLADRELLDNEWSMTGKRSGRKSDYATARLRARFIAHEEYGVVLALPAAGVERITEVTLRTLHNALAHDIESAADLYQENAQVLVQATGHGYVADAFAFDRDVQRRSEMAFAAYQLHLRWHALDALGDVKGGTLSDFLVVLRKLREEHNAVLLDGSAHAASASLYANYVSGMHHVERTYAMLLDSMINKVIHEQDLINAQWNKVLDRIETIIGYLTSLIDQN